MPASGICLTESLSWIPLSSHLRVIPVGTHTWTCIAERKCVLHPPPGCFLIISVVLFCLCFLFNFVYSANSLSRSRPLILGNRASILCLVLLSPTDQFCMDREGSYSVFFHYCWKEKEPHCPLTSAAGQGPKRASAHWLCDRGRWSEPKL